MAKKVLLVSGFQNRKFNSRSKWKKLISRLEEEGYLILVSDYGHGEPTRGPISDFGKELAKEIKMFRPKVIIAHSMGCLVARWAVEQMNCGYPGLKLILIEGPHEGLPQKSLSLKGLAVRMAELLKKLPDRSVPEWDSWKDMQKNSEFLNRLNLSGLDNHLLRHPIYYYEIGGLFARLFPETFNMSQEKICCREQMIFPRVTHSGLKADDEVIAHIMEIIKK